MKASRKTKRGVIGACVLAGVLALGGYAMTDVLGVPTTSHAGDGTQAIENVNVTAGTLHYTLDSTNPNIINTISFKLDKVIQAGGAIWTQPVTSSGAAGGPGTSDLGHWYSCTLNTAVTDTITCDARTAAAGGTGAVPAVGKDLQAADVDQVRVVAAD